MRNRYLIDIPHPHFVHFFKNIILQLGKSNVIITCQDSGVIVELLKQQGFDYLVIGGKYPTLIKKAYGQFRYFLKYMKIIRANKITHVFGMSPAVSLAAKLSGIKMYFFDDDDSSVQPITRKITIPLSDYIITPKCLEFENYGSKQFTYKGYQELAYLAPSYFNPDISVISKYGLEPESYFVLRFNDFNAHHDIGNTGIPEEIKDSLISFLKSYGKVYITSEGELSKKFEKYQLKINPIDIHHVLSFALMYIGDSQTMTSEAAVLGTPAIRCNTFKGRIAYLKELENRYQLTYAFLPSEAELMFVKIKSLLEQNYLKQIWKERKDSMLSEMVDVNKFIVNLIRQDESLT
jgi:uncharacterized protein